MFVSITLKKVAAFLRQHHNGAAMAWHADGLNQTLFAKMANVGRTVVRWCVLVITKLTSWHDPERADGGQGASFASAEGVFASTIANDFSLWSTRKIDVTRERITRISISLLTLKAVY